MFNSLTFSFFIVDNLFLLQTSSLSSVPFHQILLHSYIKIDTPLDLKDDI